MEIKILRTESDYEAALKETEKLFDAKPGTREGDKLELLALLIEKYEEEHYAIEPPHPIEAIKFRMEQMGLHQKDLVDCFGDKSKVSEVLSMKRKLNLNYIRKLHEKLNISLEALTADYQLKGGSPMR